MARCPECGVEIEIEDVEIGEIVDCEECGTELEVISVDPIEFAVISDEEFEDEWIDLDEE